ncbi:MAG: hypothetical protein KZQ83_00850 [gamma proteobacterium symbiont of Taylorina sp.]|nr:hypothetical protein [gamma proteobacterium symbiont of Taylorina sp.]
MKYVFQHTAIIEHEIDAENIVEARQKFYSDVAESQEFFTTASNVVTDERIKILNEKGHHIDTFNIYDG